MKNKNCFSICLMLIFVLVCGKIQAQGISSSFKKISNYSYRTKLKNVFLFFEGDTLDFKYKQLGSIEVSGRDFEDDTAMIDRLKFTAYQNCANAVIQISTQRAEKNYGGDFRTDARTYIRKTYRGIAVRIESDSLYKSNHFGNASDISFIKNTFIYNHERRKKAKITLISAAAVSVLMIGIYVLKTYY
jgi:hypothetical protein